MSELLNNADGGPISPSYTETLIVEPALNGWRRFKDFQHDPKVALYLVIPVGRMVDVARYEDGKFIEHEHDDWELDVLYWMPIPPVPQEMSQWFYGEPNGYRLRLQPPWRSEEDWNETLRGERESREQLEKFAPVGSVVQFKDSLKPPYGRFENKEGTVQSVDSNGYMVLIELDNLWFVEREQITKVIQRGIETDDVEVSRGSRCR